ncbi:MAG: hypothetical protein WD100_10075 [Tistlia sp.]|uniref:hypothetical protein n=1 Tax=Tistlia sp. TaxID=3057121 RepID=UPI0034A5D110
MDTTPLEPAACEAGASERDVEAQVFDHLYATLSILDQKASTILTINSILGAVFFVYFLSADAPAPYYFVGSAVGAGAVLVSSWILIFVIWVYWSPVEHLETPQTLLRELLRVRRRRTIRYRVAWNFTLLAMACLPLILAGQVWDFFELSSLLARTLGGG